MDVRIQSIHFDASEQLQAFIQKKVSKLEKYYEDIKKVEVSLKVCLLYTSPSPRDRTRSRMPSSA